MTTSTSDPVSIHQPLLDSFRVATNNLAARVVAHDKAIIAAGQMTPAQAEEGAAIVSTLYALGVSATNPIPEPSITRATPQPIENIVPIPPEVFGVSAASTTSPSSLRPFGTYEVAKGGTLDVPASEGVLSNAVSKGTDDVSLTASVLTEPSHSSAFTLNVDGSFHYVHDGSDTVADTFTYHTNNDLQTDPGHIISIAVTSAPVVV